MADVESNGAQESRLLIPCIKSLKRTYDLYTANHLNPRGWDDTESQRIKLYSKVQDEYALVRDLPPPAPASRAVAVPPPTTTTITTTAPTETAVTLPSGDQFITGGGSVSYGEIRDEGEEPIKVVGGHAYPSGPGMFCAQEAQERSKGGDEK